MSSHDVRDMLDLPDATARPAKKLKVSGPRPMLKGLAREVQNLSGDNPIAIVPEVSSSFKKKRFVNRKPAAKWDLKPFKNSARGENPLVLRHWRRKTEAPPVLVDGDGDREMADARPKPEIEDSTFAKYNVQVNIPKYNDEQYKLKLQSEDWSRQETDYLMEIVEEYDLRWPVIWDRYEYKPVVPQGEGGVAEGIIIPVQKERTVEDMKARYYFVIGTIMAVHKPPEYMKQDEFQLHELMLQFNPAQETTRKQFAAAALNRTKEEAREEESLLLELKRILARSERLSEERRELYARLEAPPSTGNIGVYTSSHGLQQLLQQLMQVDKSKKRKSLMGAEGISPASGPSGLNQQPGFDRRDSTNRESISGPSGSNNANKKGPSQGPSERRDLAEHEMQVYGVSHHDRLAASGPAYRQERILKPITSKSSVQQQKITNVLTELEIPSRLIMPTSDVGQVFESLLGDVHTLLEMRKLADKLAGEINILKAQKEEREKRARAEMREREPRNENDARVGDGNDAVNGHENVKMEDEGAREKSAAPINMGGSGHKRSASVLSTLSDKSAKRQKK